MESSSSSSTLNPTRTTSLVVSSADRDKTVFPSASHYEITLDEAVHDVTTMQLVVADVPFVAYLIQSTNASIQVVLQNGSIINAVLPTGDYSGPDLALAVQTALQGQFTSTFSTLTDNIGVGCSTSPFSLVFSKIGSCALELGFGVGKSYPSMGPLNQVVAPFRRNSHTHPSVVLTILPASVNTSVNQFDNQSFAILTPSRISLSAADDSLALKHFNPPIARFSRIVLDFTNHDGSPVDFQNHEHRLEVRLVSLRAAKYIV